MVPLIQFAERRESKNLVLVAVAGVEAASAPASASAARAGNRNPNRKFRVLPPFQYLYIRRAVRRETKVCRAPILFLPEM